MATEQQLTELCHQHLWGPFDIPPDSASLNIAPTLAEQYLRSSLIEELAAYCAHPVVEATFARMAMNPAEHDTLRIEGTQHLLNCGSRILESILLSMVCDDDEFLRRTALEGLYLHGSPQLLMAARYLQHDGDEEIRDLSAAILNDDDILLYELDPPPLD